MFRDLLETRICTDPGPDDLEEAPRDPKARAMLRMEDAAKRSGFGGMIKATHRRIKATGDAAKLRGIVDATASYVVDLQGLGNAAAKKARVSEDEPSETDGLGMGE